jgi:hypothetical protein
MIRKTGGQEAAIVVIKELEGKKRHAKAKG